MVNRLTRLLLLTLISIGFISSGLTKELADYRLGDQVAEDIITPVPLMVVDPTRAIPSVSVGLHARDRLLASVAVTSEQQLTCLHVVCGAANDRLLNEAVHLRHATRYVRFITVDALMRLTGLVESRHVSAEQAIGVLRPASTLADPVVALLSPPLWR